MLQISVSSSISPALDGATTIVIAAQTINELMHKLIERYPRIESQCATGIAVAINGEIYRDNWGVEIPQDSEVYLLPRIPGG
ncbi:MAG: molybdopterin synthase sulfur carrier subunit [Gammaproteobacteria bacterium]|jgi:molybdopterin synthase sulfur carrier subunit